MPFCPRCGAQVTASMAFCTRCGAGLTSPVDAAPGIAVPEGAVFPATPVATRGPKGTTREPWLVLVLTLVTLGIYALFFWWQTSKEVDAYAQKPGHSHKLVRIGTLLALATLALLLMFMISVGGAVLGARGDVTDATITSAILGAVGTFLLMAATGIAAAVIHLMGRYRVWDILEREERQRSDPNPLSAGLMVALVLAAYVVPFVGIALPFVVLYMTQEHLNRLWAY